MAGGAGGGAGHALAGKEREVCETSNAHALRTGEQGRAGGAAQGGAAGHERGGGGAHVHARAEGEWNGRALDDGGGGESEAWADGGGREEQTTAWEDTVRWLSENGLVACRPEAIGERGEEEELRRGRGVLVPAEGCDVLLREMEAASAGERQERDKEGWQRLMGRVFEGGKREGSEWRHGGRGVEAEAEGPRVVAVLNDERTAKD
eukprot:6338643-Prymnesium_polylepis.1